MASIRNGHHLKHERPKQRYVSAPFSKAESTNQPEHSAAFPKRFSHSGYLDIRTHRKKAWKRRYFVVNNNFLLCAATPHAKRLEGVYPLEGSSIKSKRLSNEFTPGGGSMTFQLFIRKHQLLFRAASPQQCLHWKQHIERASKLKIKDVYRFLYTLGCSESQMAKVVAAKHRTTGEDCAIKIVDKRSCESKMLKTEIQILKKLDNPYIVQLYDIFETKKYLYIVMEMCAGGELFDQIAQLDGEHYTEQDCCLILHQIARGVKYMHQIGIVHRDLKPENILCVHRDSIKRVKLADFGISKMYSNKTNKASNRSMHTIVGTLSYTAPEILRGKGYDHRVDFWSIGVIMYILLCGYPPFWGETEHDISRSILKEEVEFEEEDWCHVAQETRDLVAGLLQKDPSKRSTTEHLLNLTFKLSSKNVGFKNARNNFKKTVLKRKFHRRSMGTFERNPYQFKSHDDLTGNFNQKVLDKNNRLKKAWASKRGSKSTEELTELQLPITKRDSLMVNFETDDDRRKRKERKKKEIENAQNDEEHKSD
eukprot:14602_1